MRDAVLAHLDGVHGTHPLAGAAAQTSGGAYLAAPLVHHLVDAPGVAHVVEFVGRQIAAATTHHCHRDLLGLEGDARDTGDLGLFVVGGGFASVELGLTFGQTLAYPSGCD